jgi:hypothetical protein
MMCADGGTGELSASLGLIPLDNTGRDPPAVAQLDPFTPGPFPDGLVLDTVRTGSSPGRPAGPAGRHTTATDPTRAEDELCQRPAQLVRVLRVDVNLVVGAVQAERQRLGGFAAVDIVKRLAAYVDQHGGGDPDDRAEHHAQDHPQELTWPGAGDPQPPNLAALAFDRLGRSSQDLRQGITKSFPVEIDWRAHERLLEGANEKVVGGRGRGERALADVCDTSGNDRDGRRTSNVGDNDRATVDWDDLGHDLGPGFDPFSGADDAVNGSIWVDATNGYLSAISTRWTDPEQ